MQDSPRNDHYSRATWLFNVLVTTPSKAGHLSLYSFLRTSAARRGRSVLSGSPFLLPFVTAAIAAALWTTPYNARMFLPPEISTVAAAKREAQQQSESAISWRSMERSEAPSGRIVARNQRSNNKRAQSVSEKMVRRVSSKAVYSQTISCVLRTQPTEGELFSFWPP